MSEALFANGVDLSDLSNKIEANGVNLHNTFPETFIMEKHEFAPQNVNTETLHISAKPAL